jgi:GNAT superfamily N-acetyltransferase
MLGINPSMTTDNVCNSIGLPRFNMTDLIVRLYEDRDFETACALFHKISKHYGIGTLPSLEETKSYVAERVLGLGSNVTIALAMQDNIAVGLATFTVLYPSPNGKGQLYMKDLFVEAGQRGGGVGKSLMTFVAGYALDHACERFDWTTETTNPSAMAFYQGLGARPVNEKVYYRISGEDLRAFVKGV